MTATPTKARFWKTAFFFGFPAGALVISWMVANYYIVGFKSSGSAMAIGFLIMFVILSLIFFGIKRFRDREQGGVINFSKALFLGLAMSLFAGIGYVIFSEIFLAMTGDQFINEYTNHLIAEEKAKGVSEEALKAFTDKMMALKESYRSPMFRIPVTFSEIFPMGVIVSLVSALALHTPKFWARR